MLIRSNVVLRVPIGTAGAYRSVTGWKNFASITENILTSEYVTLKVFHNDGGDVIINGIKVDSDT